MSWSVWLEINTGKEFQQIGESRNYTYNVYPMYSKAMGKSISDFDEQKATNIIPILKKGITEMINNRKEYEKLNPPNNWGDYKSALEYLQWILEQCEDNPLCIVRVG